MDVASIPQYQKKNVDAIDFDDLLAESNQLQKLSWSYHHDQKKNPDGEESNHLRKLSSSDHDDHKKKNLERYERRKEQTRKARSKLLSMPGFSPADFWIDDHLSNEDIILSLKQEQEWRASNTCTSCGSFNWKCRCKLVHIEELWKAREALKGPSTPVKTEPKETLLSFVLGRL